MRTPQLLNRTHCLSRGSIPYSPFLSIGETLDLVVIKIIMTSFLCSMLTGVIKILPKSKLHRLPSADDSFHNLSGLKFKADKDYFGSTELPYHYMYQFHDFICGLQKNSVHKRLPHIATS